MTAESADCRTPVATADPAAGHGDRCPFCHGTTLALRLARGTDQVWQCHECALVFLHPQPTDATLGAIYSDRYFLGGDDPDTRRRVSGMKRATARLYLQQIVRRCAEGPVSLLEIGCGQGEFLIEARRQGFAVTGLDVSTAAAEVANHNIGTACVSAGSIETAGLPAHTFDVCMLSDVIEHARDPVAFMEAVHRVLKPGGLILIATPSLDSWSSRLLGRHWMEYKTEHLFYFSRATIQSLLARTGFDEVEVERNRKVLTAEYVRHHFDRFTVPILTPLIRMGSGLLPGFLRRREIALVASGMVVMARARERRPRPLLSIVIPAFNERATFEELVQRVLAKPLPGIDRELVIVESNSSDGTRELALAYQHHPQVQLVLQDRPRGKGAAVRAGLTRARGDWILIQDADLEYDVEDYDVLLEPLRRHQRAFVLGSRHAGHWGLRALPGQPVVSVLMNVGHLAFLTAFNVLYGQRLRDPFTMYKVFRRDCLHRLTFSANRFDFDFELVIKLLRKGYLPIEIPVRYHSRSFGEGKKVSMIRDPLSWILALVRYRLTPLYAKGQGE